MRILQHSSHSVLFVFALLLPSNYAILVAKGADPTDLVQGVTEIVSPGSPGPIHPTSSAWWNIVGGDDDVKYPSLFVAAREYGAGRIVVDGHEGVVTHPQDLDNTAFLLNIFHWLDSAGNGQLRFTTGHNEYAVGNRLNALVSVLGDDGMSLTALSSPITADHLQSVSVLFIGNAWSSFTSDEIEVVRAWVEAGGGLYMTGLGWSWEVYHEDQSMEDYPMMQMSLPYEVRWLRGSIVDPTNQYQGSTVFSVFYPNIHLTTIEESFSLLHANHAQYGSTIGLRLSFDETLRLNFVRAHQTLSIPAYEFPMDHPERQEVFDGYLTLFEQYPDFYARGFSFPEWAYPTATWTRERAWRSWRDALELTIERRGIISDAGLVDGARRDLFMAFDLLLLDNDRLGSHEIIKIQDTLTLVPRQLFDLRYISVVDYLGTPPLEVGLSGLRYGVNVFGIDIGDYTENPFPPDVDEYDADVFFSVLAHEVNHVVDAMTINNSPILSGRKQSLIADAGNDSLNYLRSMIPDEFFAQNPQEFFASISNQWLNNSERTLALGLVRFDNGRLDPINQALFFADVYSGEGDTTYFYTTDAEANITRRSVAVERDGFGWITALVDGMIRYEFQVDSAGNVIGYAIINLCPPDLNDDGRLDFFDLQVFLNWYASGDLQADFISDGILDFFDVQQYLNLYSAGCP
jgi:hypothetical protein